MTQGGVRRAVIRRAMDCDVFEEEEAIGELVGLSEDELEWLSEGDVGEMGEEASDARDGRP